MNFKLQIKNIENLQNIINYKFKNINYLKEALIHSSAANEMNLSHNNSNERLEFLGDAILEFVVSDYIFSKYIYMDEGELTKLRAKIVCEESLNFCAKKINLSNYLILGRGEDKSGGRNRVHIVVDALEALIASIYFDGGFNKVKEFILKFIIKIQKDKYIFNDYKSYFKEFIQSKFNNVNIKYSSCLNVIDNKNVYKVDIYINNKFISTGFGDNKKKAEQNASKKALNIYKKEHNEKFEN